MDDQPQAQHPNPPAGAPPPTPPATFTPSEGKERRWPGVIASLLLFAALAGFLFLNRGSLFSKRANRGAAARPVPTVTVTSAATTTTLLDRAGVLISAQELDDFEVACHALGLQGEDGYCRCVRLRLPGRVLLDEIRQAELVLLRGSGTLPPTVEAIMRSCAAANPVPSGTIPNGTIPTSTVPNGTAPATKTPASITSPVPSITRPSS